MSVNRKGGPMVSALVMTHGGIAAELVRVTEMILGPVEGLAAMSNADHSAESITHEVKEWLANGSDPDAGRVILLDDMGLGGAQAGYLGE